VGWIVEPDLARYAARVVPWLERDPVENTVQCTALRTRLRRRESDEEPPWLAWFADRDGAVAGAALRTPPRGLLLSALPPDAVDPLVHASLVAYPDLPRVIGPAGTIDRFLAAWAGHTHGTADLVMRELLYRLDEVIPPPAVPGVLEPASNPDLDLVVRWFREFVADIRVPPRPDNAAIAQLVVSEGRIYLWRVDGEPVCMVGHTEPVAGVPRVGPVYTPPPHRGHGYATVATAGVSSRLLAAGATACVLFADRENPTSNGVYRRIGFYPVGEHEDWSLNQP
jgi:GNAT superfamily N-acetyltransferase